MRSENPINFPYKIYPFEYKNKFINGKLYPKLDMKNEKLGNDIIKHLNIIGCEMKGLQWNVYQKYYFHETKIASFDAGGLQLSNIVFGEDLDIGIDDINSDTHYGRTAFGMAIEYTDRNGILSCKINEDYKENFNLDNLKFISCKLHTFISGIQNKMPEGIIFVYSQFIPAGIWCVAIFLELIGVKNYNGKNILKNINIEPLLDQNGKQMKYLMKTGEISNDFDNYKDKDEVNNMDGSIVKFILGTKAASEGISILNVREIHILDPWYHLNRIEQTNGRGIRNCSHKLLELNKRNVSIYMYAAIEPENVRESSDLKKYRNSELKAINMGKVQAIVKSTAMDCYLNKEGNNYLSELWDKEVDIIDSRGNKIKYNLSDKPFTDLCNYSTEKKCKPLKCYNERKTDTTKIQDNTYLKEFSIKDIEYYQELIKDIFKNMDENGNKKSFIKVVFKLEDIKKYIKNNDQMSIEDRYRDDIIYFALHELIKREIEIVDIYNRPGRILNKNNYYIFQPLGLADDIPITYRRMNYNVKYNKIMLKNLVIKNKKTKIKSIVNDNKVKTMKKTDRDLNEAINSFCKIAFDIENNFYKENIETKKKANIKEHLNFLDKIEFLKEIVITEFQYDHLLMIDKELIIKYLVLKIKEVSYNRDLLNDLVNLESINKNEILRYLNISLRQIFKNNGENDLEIVNNNLNYLIRYCLFNHFEFNRKEESGMNKDYLGYRIYLSKTNGRKVDSKLNSYKLQRNTFVNPTNQEIVILESYHEEYRLNKYRNRDLNEVYGLYFCDRIKFKIVDNRDSSISNKRTVKCGVGCNNSSTTNRDLLKPLMKTLKDGKRLLDDNANQKYKCLIIELFFRYKEHLSQQEAPKGNLYFFNQGLYGLDL